MRYKKITKPLLERKRRARINACLDELKDIMTVALQAEGENVSKLEKADILELTVRHLHKLNQAKRLSLRNPLEELQKFQAGYSSCAQEAATFLLSAPGVDVRVGQRLMSHLLQPGVGSPVPQATAHPRLTMAPPASYSHHSPSQAPGLSPFPLLPSSSSPPRPPDVKYSASIEERTLPVKPAAVRLTASCSSLLAQVWKPYS
jgi:hairy-and-enhancer-of-split protein